MENKPNSFQQYQMNSESQEINQDSGNQGNSKLNFQNILNNKFDYFNNKPSKYSALLCRLWLSELCFLLQRLLDTMLHHSTGTFSA